MGTFETRVTVSNIVEERSETVASLVDTGATDSVFPGELLGYLGVQRGTLPPVEYITADGTAVYCERGSATLEVEVEPETWIKGIVPVAFWPDDSNYCIGATTLQILMLGVDPPNERLVRITQGRHGWSGALR